MTTHCRVTVAPGVSLHYIEAGSGAPLILIPGWSLSAACFRDQIAAFSQTHRVLAFDMRGHGESDKPAHGYRIQRLAADLHAAISALSLERPHVLGHSMGCSVIWSYLSLFGAQRPLGKLVLVDQAPAVVAQDGWDAEQIAEAGSFILDPAALAAFEAQVRAADSLASAIELLRGMFTAAVKESDLAWFASENLKIPRDRAARLLHDHCVLDWRSDMATISNPTLVVGGEASIFSAASQRWIAAQIAHAQVEIFASNDGGSHCMFFENSQRFNATVSEFLTQPAAPSR
jgi:non-heme chloroperoxidase